MNEDKASRYHRLKRWSHVASLGWTLALFVGLLWSGASIVMRNAAERGAASIVGHGGWHPGITVVVYVGFLLLLNEIGSLPLALYSGFVLEHRYGLSNERAGRWLVDQTKSLALGFLLSSAAAAIVYAAIRYSPQGWWLPAGLVLAAIVIGLTNIAPVLLLPIFYPVKPLDRESLRVRLVGLADRAGAKVLGAYEWGLGEKTRKANAALAGLGTTRRILVSDTMLAEYTDDEIEVVLAHEIGHHVHGDIWKGILFESTLILAGLYCAARVLGGLAPSLGFRGSADVAAMPLLILAAGAVSFVMLPLAHAMSRAFERSADRFALALTGNPAAFVSAMRRLAAQNLAEEHPSRLVQMLFYSHPPVRERIAAAQAFGMTGARS
jgi:Zn-dependent protease with chaperone function